MCRIFAYAGHGRDLRPYLVGKNPSLRTLACDHAEGWGVAAWSGPHAPAWVTKSPGSAEKDQEFDRAATIQAPLVLAHIRNASRGAPRWANAHPFAFGPWAFAHNGTIVGMDPGAAVARLSPFVQSLRVGETDSEAAFLAILDAILQSPAGVDASLADAAPIVARFARAYVDEGSGAPEHGVNFVLGNGEGFLVTCFGRELSFLGDGRETLVASVPMGSTLTDPWTRVPDGSLLVVRPGAVDQLGF